MASAEQKKSYQVIKQFKGLNTKANRTAIDETEFSWIENVMPIGYGNIKVTPKWSELGVSFLSPIVNLSSFNINGRDFLVAFENDGSAEIVDVTDPGDITIDVMADPGTFSTTGKINVSQWRDKYLTIIDPVKGYFIWDGTHIVSVGAVGRIGIVNPGSGYKTAPTVTLSAPDQTGGTQATATCTITSTAGTVTGILVTNDGSNYTTVPTVTIDPPPEPGIQATAAATLLSAKVVSIAVINPGSGYVTAPNVSITGGGGTSATANATIDTGSIMSISLTNAGSGYSVPPTVTFTGGGGTGADAEAELISFATGTLTVNVTSGGYGYTNAANTVVTIGNSTGWVTQAVGTAIVSGGQVTQVIMSNEGSGYTNTSNITVTISGGGATTNATANAVVNTDENVGIASFSGRMWIAAGRNVFYTAASSPTDFTSVSAGSIAMLDSTLHGNITQLLSANNFLYVFGDDSINVFSDVRVTNTGTTLFTNTNISASVGSRLPYAIFPYFRSVLFMNDYGIYALVGSTTSKVSDALDGIFPYIDFSYPVYGGQVLINNILCAAFNFRYNGPGAGTTNVDRFIQAVFFDKKWFLTFQGEMPFVTSSPSSGFINLYGSLGTNCVQLFSDKTNNNDWTFQTALLPFGDPIRTKQALKFGVEAITGGGAPINVTVDSETTSTQPYVLSKNIVWINNYGQTVLWAFVG